MLSGKSEGRPAILTVEVEASVPCLACVMKASGDSIDRGA
jgi:hypothetical protein